MRDWRGVQAAVGDRVFYVTADGIQEPVKGQGFA